MDWFFSIIRIAGVTFPGAAALGTALVQLQAEIDSASLKKRVSKLEDPISWLHADVPELSRHLYRKLKAENSLKMYFNDEFYVRYSRALAALETCGYLKGSHALGKRFAAGLWIPNTIWSKSLLGMRASRTKGNSLSRRPNITKWQVFTSPT